MRPAVSLVFIPPEEADGARAGVGTDDTGYAGFTNHRPAYGVTACDLDDDGAPELMVSAYGRQPNLLYRNDGAGRFQDQSVDSGFATDGNMDFSDNQNFRCWCTANRTASGASTTSCHPARRPSRRCSPIR